MAKVIADLDLKEDSIKVTDIREWIGEAVEKIGSVRQLINKVSGVDGAPTIEIVGHQAQLPCDLHHLKQVAYSVSPCGPWAHMRKATGNFSVWGCKEECNHNDKYVHDDILVDLTIDIFGNLDKSEAIHILNTNQNTRTILTQLLNKAGGSATKTASNTSLNESSDLQYSIKPGYIMTNVPCGYLKLSYTAVPVDEDNYPLVPDLASYSEAIYWYITMKLKYPDYLNGRMNREIYYDIRRSWNFYRQQAYAESIMPNADDMESIGNAWLKLYPEVRDHETFYSYTGEMQKTYKAS